MGDEKSGVGAGSNYPHQELVRVVVRDIVATAAPNEIPVVEGLVSLSDGEVIRLLMRRRKKSDPLGFGVEELTVLATPVVWLAINEAAVRAGAAAVDGATTGLKALTRKVFRRPTVARQVPSMTADQLREVHRFVLELSEQRGLGAERASGIADAVVARLAMNPSDQMWAPDPAADPDTSGTTHG